ncbi:hypothetical protein PENTCL1PPCAC_14417, partial [Pristionchus entomophagus]
LREGVDINQAIMILAELTFARYFYEQIGVEASETSANSHQVAEEVISTIRTVRSFAAEKRSSRRFADAVDIEQRVAGKEALGMFGLQL